MASIAGFNFTTWQGRLHKAGRLTARLDPMPGVTGNLVVRSAWRAREDEIRTTVQFSGTLSTARRLRDSYLALSGTVVTVIDQFGEAWSCTVLDVVPEISTTVFSSTMRVEARWRLLPQTTEPT